MVDRAIIRLSVLVAVSGAQRLGGVALGCLRRALGAKILLGLLPGDAADAGGEGPERGQDDGQIKHFPGCHDGSLLLGACRKQQHGGFWL